MPSIMSTIEHLRHHIEYLEEDKESAKNYYPSITNEYRIRILDSFDKDIEVLKHTISLLETIQNGYREWPDEDDYDDNDHLSS